MSAVDDLAHLLVNTRLELGGVFVAALSGGLAAVRKDFDVFGVLVLACPTGLGGGVVRDVLIGIHPPVGIASWGYVATALLAGLAVLLFHPRVARNRRAVVVLDAGALGVFVLLGTMKALGSGAGVTVQPMRSSTSDQSPRGGLRSFFTSVRRCFVCSLRS